MYKIPHCVTNDNFYITLQNVGTGRDKALKEPYMNNPRCNRGLYVSVPSAALKELNILIFITPIQGFRSSS